MAADHDNLGDLDISTLLISQKSGHGGLTYYITIGTDSSANKTASHYTLDPRDNANPYKNFTLAGVADENLELTPGTLRNEPGVFTLFREPGSQTGVEDGPIACSFDTIDGRLHFAINLSPLGQINGLWSNANPFGLDSLPILKHI